MITAFREFTKSWFFKGLMVLLIASFAIFGLTDAFNKTGGNDVITAGKREISSSDFKSRFEVIKENYPKENKGQTFTNEEYVAAGAHIRLLNQMADETAFAAWLDSIGIKPSAKMIVAEIGKIPAFFNSVTGRFDKDTYRQLLARNNMTEKSFEQNMSDEIAGQQYLSAAVAGFKAPRIYAAAEAAVTLQNRDASLFVVNQSNITMPAPPTEADLNAFYTARLPQLQMPELRQASVVRFAADNYKDIKVDEAAVRKLYDTRLATLAAPETRRFVQVTAQNAGDANAIASALKAGKTPEDAAKAHKGQVITYDLKPKAAVPDAKIGNAAFALKTGDISGAIQGELGYAVIKMGEIKTGSTPSYDSVHAQLVQDYLKEEAANRVNKDSNAFSDAIRAGKNFDATAKELGLTVVKLEPMTADGQTNNPRANYSNYTTLVKAIYDLPSAGSASDVEELGEGQYFAVRLDAVKPAGAPPFAQIKNELAQYWMAEKVGAAIQAKASEASARLNKGEAFAAVAASLNAPVRQFPGLSRATAQQSGLPNPVLGRVFAGKAGETFNAPINQMNIAIGRIDAVHQADVSSANMMSTAVRAQMTQSVQQDIATTNRTEARTLVKTATYPNTAELALGITPADPKADKKDDKKPAEKAKP
ncbi:Peptidyl-prolyl cis-trans isomerase D [Asticcacaulis sp. MM231]|uniref:peptidylprolyl isomerase n=1 Tax=Asticcacaulis sp. MM231 TaxID=3157666 RepID=UPI0032D5A628